MSLVEFDGVTKRYGDVVAVEDVSLALAPGQYHCLIGPNGSGKTTLMRLLLGLTRPSSGRVERGDATIGCGFQTPNFYPSLTVRENVDVFEHMAGSPDPEWREELLAELRLERALDRRAGDLSGGFARKLDLTLALLDRPDLLVLDEPLGALDDVSTERALAFLERYADAGHSVLVSTHHVGRFEGVLDRVTVMHRGEIALDADPAGLDLSGHDSLQDYYVDLVLARDA